MTFSRYTLRPSFRAALLAFLVHHNPFYLLSALFMVAGCYALNSGLAPRTGDLGKLLALFATLNFYELVVIALGLYLVRRRGIVRDGRTLLLIEAPFLVDLAFLNAEAGAVSTTVGLLLGSAALLLALMKAGAVLRVLWGRIPLRVFSVIAMELFALFLLPTAFSYFEHQGDATQGQFYAAWWLAGALLAMYEIQEWLLGPEAGSADVGLRVLVRRLYMTLPIASLIVHLLMLHWVYRVQFVLGDLSPLLIGGAFALGRSSHRFRRDLKLLRALMPALAVMLAVRFPPAVHARLADRLEFTPVVATVAAAYAAYVYCFFLSRVLPLAIAGAAAGFLAVFGPTVAQIWAATLWIESRAAQLLMRLMPRTAVEWGLTAMASAFAFLALGAAVSLKKQPSAEPAENAILP